MRLLVPHPDPTHLPQLAPPNGPKLHSFPWLLDLPRRKDKRRNTRLSYRKSMFWSKCGNTGFHRFPREAVHSCTPRLMPCQASACSLGHTASIPYLVDASGRREQAGGRRLGSQPPSLNPSPSILPHGTLPLSYAALTCTALPCRRRVPPAMQLQPTAKPAETRPRRALGGLAFHRQGCD